MKIAMSLMIVFLLMMTVAVGLTPGTVNAGTTTPVVQDPTFFCRTNWNNGASARHTCNSVSMSKIGSDDKYKISANCERAYRANEYRSSTITVTDSRRCGDVTNCDGIMRFSCN